MEESKKRLSLHNYTIPTGALSSEDLSNDFMIDECHVKADPPLDLIIEHLSLPSELMEEHGLEWTETNSGVVIKSECDQIKSILNALYN